TWAQIPSTLKKNDPTEGLVVAEYELTYSDGSKHVQPVRSRFEVALEESPGPAWLAVPFKMPTTVELENFPEDVPWSRAQMRLHVTLPRSTQPLPLVYAMPNPNPGKKIKELTITGLQESPLHVAGITLYRGAGHPLRHLPRRSYRVKTPGKSKKIENAEVDLGTVVRMEHTHGSRGKTWLKSKYVGVNSRHDAGVLEPERNSEDVMDLAGAEDGSVDVQLEGRKKPVSFSLGEAFHKGRSKKGNASLEILDREHQWMQIKVIDKSTGKPTPVRIHMTDPRGRYIAPYGHHNDINIGWFEDYGADIWVAGKNFAYVHGEFTSDMPTGEIYIEINKGFEYAPIRKKVTIKPGQKKLELKIDRWKDLRSDGWVTADTHVHFISPHTAWLEGQAEGVNVINLLASQWGRLFTNVGDLTGRVGVAENDTIVYVGTENRNHMLGHMSMLGTKGEVPVYPMCCGGPGESWVGDPDFRMLAEWALENKRKGGVVIRPHYPMCGNTEDPVPIISGLVDALEICMHRGRTYPTQEWYRYLNCGYRVAVCGGTDKMNAASPVGWTRTYAKLDPNRPFTYNNWSKAVRGGRTFSTTGPVIDIAVDGNMIGDTIKMTENGGTVEVHATAESFMPLGRLELVYNGRVVAHKAFPKGAKKITLKTKLKIPGSGWIAARCVGLISHPHGYAAAHTSPVYITCGNTRAFNGPAAEHMLALVEGGVEYLNTIATMYDESSRKRMVKLFKEVRKELKGRLVVESGHTHHHGHGAYHTHGHGHGAGHSH
ncbi:CehA/McbA family metallohydrolase, partial [Candidatus Hydrogenedentota bacterium]